MDIYLVNGAPLNKSKPDVLSTIHLFHNHGDGAFTNVTQEFGINLHGRGNGVVWTNIDNDNWIDRFFAYGHLHDNIEKFEEVGVYKQANQLFYVF